MLLQKSGKQSSLETEKIEEGGQMLSDSVIQGKKDQSHLTVHIIFFVKCNIFSILSISEIMRRNVKYKPENEGKKAAESRA